jgi:hypothetical protein
VITGDRGLRRETRSERATRVAADNNAAEAALPAITRTGIRGACAWFLPFTAAAGYVINRTECAAPMHGSRA